MSADGKLFYFYKILFPLPLKNSKYSRSSNVLHIYRGNKVLTSNCYTRYLMNLVSFPGVSL